MGSINHSMTLMAEHQLPFSSVPPDMPKAHIAAQPCVSVCADKVTLNRRTIAIVAVITVVPGDPGTGTLQSFVIDAPVV